MNEVIPRELIWSHQGRTIIGDGPWQRFDPGIGPTRYQRALDRLRGSGKSTAFASFTFDPSEHGSVVMIPEAVSEGSPTSWASGKLPHGRVRSDGKPSWQDGIEQALAALSAGTIEKVVLTRQIRIEFEEPISTRDVANRLIEQQKDCYVFAVDGLVGASPELLVSLTDDTITSLVLAGTAPTAESLDSAKMDLEHLLAASSVEDGISKHVTELEAPTRAVLGFGDIKHLATRFVGRATNGTTVLDLLSTLHPTASVAGSPTGAALDLIRRLEPKERGRYGGPVGWFNAEGEGEFAIALRCGLVEGEQVTLFAGGGLVNGSDAVSEFAETELKLRPMLQALAVE